MSDNKSESTSSINSDSDDLNELLKSALDDFDDTARCSPPTIKACTSSSKDEKPKTEASMKLQQDFEKKMENVLLDDTDDETFSQKMKDLLIETKNELKSCSDNSRTSVSDSNTDNENIDVVSQAINNLVEHMVEINDTIEKDPLQSNFNFDDLKNDGMFPMMEQMFQILISKEVLYPSLAAVKDQYPTWIDENKNKISATEINRYTKQYNIIKKICVIFESENDLDSENIKQQRFLELLTLFEQMTELGQPPKDLAESLPSIPPGNMSFANNVPDNCNTM